MAVSLVVDGRDVAVVDESVSLLEALRHDAGERSAKDGCSPQGQCGCCTVLVDGAPRVACVTPVRRVAGRRITTLTGLADRDRWAQAFTAHGASQCGFCTPGIIMRLAALPQPLTAEAVERALVAHLCRCTGWRTIVDAAIDPDPRPPVDLDKAAARATLEGRSPQRCGPAIACGEGGFADDTAPAGALVAVPAAGGGWAVGETLTEARANAGKVQGRRTTTALRWPLELPPGTWDVTLRTTWVEPAYLEPDASWCEPGGVPATPLANGGAFGGKVDSPVASAARRLADEHGRPVRVVLAREDVVRLGPKRPPVAAGVNRDGTGILRVVRTAGISEAIRRAAPDVTVEEVDVAGPPTSSRLRAAGWAEAAVLLAAATGARQVTSPEGAWASASLDADGTVRVEVAAGDPLDEVVLRSYCTGAAHQALGWVRSEGIALDDNGEPQDLTIRSFGIVRARDMPAVEIVVHRDDRAPINGSDAVFAAVAAAAWTDAALPGCWPTNRTER